MSKIIITKDEYSKNFAFIMAMLFVMVVMLFVFNGLGLFQYVLFKVGMTILVLLDFGMFLLLKLQYEIKK